MSKFYHGVAAILLRVFHPTFCAYDTSRAITLSALIWVLLERSFPPAEVEYMPILIKSDDVRSGGPRLVMACTIELQNWKAKAAI